MCKWILVCLIAVLSKNSYSQWQAGQPGVNSVPDSGWLDGFQPCSNPAAIVGPGTSYSFSAGTYPGIKGLRMVALAMKFGLSGANVGLTVHHLGTAGFQQNTLSLRYGKSLGKLSLGICFSAGSTAVPGVLTLLQMGAGAGVLATAGRATYGVAIDYIRPLAVKASPTLESGLHLRSQAVFRISEILSLGLMSGKYPNRQAAFGGVIHYQPATMRFAVGLDGTTDSYFFESGWKSAGFLFTIRLGYQPTLGMLSGLQVDHLKLAHP